MSLDSVYPYFVSCIFKIFYAKFENPFFCVHDERPI